MKEKALRWWLKSNQFTKHKCFPLLHVNTQASVRQERAGLYSVSTTFLKADQSNQWPTEHGAEKEKCMHACCVSNHTCVHIHTQNTHLEYGTVVTHNHFRCRKQTRDDKRIKGWKNERMKEWKNDRKEAIALCSPTKASWFSKLSSSPYAPCTDKCFLRV